LNSNEKNYKNFNQTLIIRNETEKTTKSQQFNSSILNVPQTNQPTGSGQAKRKRNRNNRRKKSVSA